MRRMVGVGVAPLGVAVQQPPRQGVLYRSPGGTTVRLMPDEGNLGKEVVVWVPGEEGRRIASRWTREP